MTISDVYKEYVRDGMDKDKAAGICLGIISGGLIDATDEETYARLKQEFIAKQNESDDDEEYDDSEDMRKAESRMLFMD